MSNPYRVLGFVLCVAGAIFAPVSYFIIGSVPFAAIGLSGIMIGFTCVALANARPYISPEACQLMLRTGMENTAAILEELGLRTRAIYLPSFLRDGHSQALIPITEDADIQQIKQKLSGRLIVRYGANPHDMAIAVTTAGSINIDVLETKPGPTSEEIESAVTYILTGVLDIADSVTVNASGNLVDAEVRGSKLHYEDIWYYHCLGSPIASIVAAVSSEALGKPVRIKEESYYKGKSKITIEALP